MTVVGPAAAAAPTDLFISEYVEGSSNNKAVELYNGTGGPVDLAAGQYVLQFYFNGSPTAGGTIALTGTVAAGDVFVLAQSSANAAILAQADQTSGASFYNGDDAIVLRAGGTAGSVVDSLGQAGMDPGTEWGTGLTSTADNTLRRDPAVTAGDTEPVDAFDPATGWLGYAVDTVDGLGGHTAGGGPVDAPATLTCGGALTLGQGQAGSRTVTAVDADDIVTDLAISAVIPAPVAGTITRTALIPALVVGGTASALIAADADLAPGSYAVTVTATDADATTSTCSFTVTVNRVLTVGEVQGSTTDGENGARDRSPLAPATGNGTSSALYDVRGVVTQRTLARTATGAGQNGFFLQSRLGGTDGDAASSDGVFVFMGAFTSLIGGYVPTVGDEVVVRGRVSEFFSMTQLSSVSLVRVIASGVTDVAVDNATPPTVLADANRFWERHEGMQLRVRAGSAAAGGRDVFASTADSEIYVLDVDDPLLDRADALTRRVYRDAHPMDNNTALRFDDGNGTRILLGTTGVKWTAQDSTTLLPPAHTFDTLTADAVGGLNYSFDKYGIQVASAQFSSGTNGGGTDPSTNNPPVAADRERELAIATYNVENLYDFRDDPFDGCDFTGNSGCTGVSPPFDYVPTSQADYDAHLAALAAQIAGDLHAPDLLLVQEAEDQDICSVSAGALVCGDVDNADGKPDTLQELALAVAATGGPAYDTAYDRDGADLRGIVAGFLYRTDRLTLAAPTSVLGAAPGVEYRAAALPYNTDVQNPKSLNAVRPADVDTSTGVDGPNVFTRAPQVARFTVAAKPGGTETHELWALSNHYSSTPDARVGQRTEQARYGAAIVAAIGAAQPNARIIFGGDLNVFPRPDDPIATSDSDTPSDQLAPLYELGLHNLWDDLAAQVPGSAYSYVFQGQAQTLDHLFVNDALYGDLLRIRAAHINADWPADYDGDGARGASDHDPQVAVFGSRARLTVADTAAVEGQPLTFTATLSRPLSQDLTVCAVSVPDTAMAMADFTPYLGCVVVPAGSTSVTFTVATRADHRTEPDERLWLALVGDPRLVDLTDPLAAGTITG